MYDPRSTDLRVLTDDLAPLAPHSRLVRSDTHRGIRRRNVVNANVARPDRQLRSRTEHTEEGITMKQFVYATAVAISLGSLGTFGGVGTAAADGLDVSPPAIIDANGTHEAPDTGSFDELTQIGDADGFQSYITSSWPAAPSWPGG
jgi:hypothetical protein